MHAAFLVWQVIELLEQYLSQEQQKEEEGVFTAKGGVVKCDMRLHHCMLLTVLSYTQILHSIPGRGLKMVHTVTGYCCCSPLTTYYTVVCWSSSAVPSRLSLPQCSDCTSDGISFYCGSAV